MQREEGGEVSARSRQRLKGAQQGGLPLLPPLELALFFRSLSRAEGERGEGEVAPKRERERGRGVDRHFGPSRSSSLDVGGAKSGPDRIGGRTGGQRLQERKRGEIWQLQQHSEREERKGTVSGGPPKMAPDERRDPPLRPPRRPRPASPRPVPRVAGYLLYCSPLPWVSARVRWVRRELRSRSQLSWEPRSGRRSVLLP